MGKRREERARAPSQADRECNLDGEYTSPVRSCRDLSLENVRDALIHSRYAQLILSLTIIGAILRFYNLGYNSLWLDEASTYTFASMSLPGIWQATAGGEFNPPLFYWVEHLMLVFGNNEFILRFVPALLGVLTIPLFYYIGNEFCDRNAGVIAAAAAAFSPFLIVYSQEARAYSMMLFFVALATLFCLRALRSNDTKEWALFGLFSALAFWSHFYAMVMIGSLVLYSLYELLPKIRRDITAGKPIIVAGLAFAILSLPLILVTIQLFFKRSASAPTFGIQGIGLIIETFRQILSSPYNLPGGDLAFFFMAVLLVIGIIQAFVLGRNKGIFLVSLMVLTFVISYLLSFRIPMLPRYLIILSVVLFLGVALAYKAVYALIAHRGVVYGFIILMLLLSLPFLLVYYSGYSKEDWRGVSGGLSEMTKNGDYVVVMPGYVLQPLNYYYTNSSDSTIELGFSTADELNALKSQKPANTTVYYVVTGDIMSADPSGGAVAWLQEHAQPIRESSNIVIFTSG